MDLCNQIWSEEQVPEEWKKGLLIKLPEKGDLSHFKNWHGIMMLNIVSKVFCRVILERIKTALDEKFREEQVGFRAGRTCKDQIATQRIIVERRTALLHNVADRVAVLLVHQLYRFRKGLR